MVKIKSIEKDDREDISNFTATLEDGTTIGVEAKDKKEAEKKIEKFLESSSSE